MKKPLLQALVIAAVLGPAVAFTQSGKTKSAGVVHGWLDIAEHVDYLSFRPSPNILTAGWVHPTIKK
jgi:hypothetical protein